MITLLSSLLALPLLYVVFTHTTAASLTSLRKNLLYILPMFGLVLLLSFSSYIGHSATVLLFILIPLAYLVYIPHALTRILQPFLTNALGSGLIFFILLYPLDLTVGYDAGRNLLEHMLSVLGFYIGLALALTLSFRWFYLTPKQVFLIGGFLGILVEQNFLGPSLLVTNPVAFIIFAPTIFLTYAIYLLGPFMLYTSAKQTHHSESGANLPTGRKKWFGIFSVFLLSATLPLLIWLLTNQLFSYFGLPVTVLNI